ncbi:MAG TPA: hypothetical protein ENG50_01930 [Candidatus Altiarchaeales archaeon]|nr:hypothetical protein [Candidatus Altiarchaeales archaeon]
MWRLSDTVAEEFKKSMDEILEAIKEYAAKLSDEVKWKELPQPIECVAYGVDGSVGSERRSGVVVYAVSGVATGDTILEMHDIATMKTYKHIDERLKLHMALMELRSGAMVEDAEIVLMDGTLSGYIIRPPAYVTDNRTYSSLVNKYDFDNLIQEFLEALEEWWIKLEKDVKKGSYRGSTLLSRSPKFDKLERRYRIESDECKDDLRVLLEYVEYLHALDKLLDSDQIIVSVAKTFYKNEFIDIPGITDCPLLEFLAYEQFGKEKAAYIPFKYRKIDKKLPRVAEYFDNVKILLDNLKACYARFTDFGNIYLLESNKEIDDELIAKIISLEADGYLLPLIYAHKHAEIKRKELKTLISALLNSVVANHPEYRLLLKYGREPLEE